MYHQNSLFTDAEKWTPKNIIFNAKLIAHEYQVNLIFDRAPCEFRFTGYTIKLIRVTPEGREEKCEGDKCHRFITHSDMKVSNLRFNGS